MVTRRVDVLVQRRQDAAFRANPVYGRVYFVLRRKLALSVSACLLGDVIDTLARRTGWCFASRDYLADLFGISIRSVQRLLQELEAKDLVERNPQRPEQLRPTRRWHEAKLSCEARQFGRHI